MEYGSDRIEMHVGAIKQGQRVLLMDDLIATGGTLAAGIYLMEKVDMVLRKGFGDRVVLESFLNTCEGLF